jgi:hypothetical protein
MSAIRKFGWLALVLAAFVGCAKEEPGPATPPSSETKPEATDAKPAPGAEPAASGEMKGPAPAGDMKGPAPAGDMPKIEAPQPTPASKEEAPAPKEEGNAAAAAKTLSSDELAEVKKLPAAEADQAVKQLLCPVSGENLGSMGVPLKVSAAGQTFFLCCKGCNKDVQDDPAAVVAKLKK